MFVLPKCRHDKIILGCPDDDCPEQNAYLAESEAALDRWQKRQQDEARLIVRELMGLPE